MGIQRQSSTATLFAAVILLTCTFSLSNAFTGNHAVRRYAVSGPKQSRVGSVDPSFKSNSPDNLSRLLMSESSEGEDVLPRTPLDRPVLAAIDAAAILAFAAVGKASHSADGSIDVFAVAMTALPFLLSWFVIAPLLGCYTPSATADIKSAVLQTGKGWIVAVPMGCVLRGIIKGYVPPTPFVIVTLISTLIILSIGRSAYTAISEVYVEMF